MILNCCADVLTEDGAFDVARLLEIEHDYRDAPFLTHGERREVHNAEVSFYGVCEGEFVVSLGVFVLAWVSGESTLIAAHALKNRTGLIDLARDHFITRFINCESKYIKAAGNVSYRC